MRIQSLSGERKDLRAMSATCDSGSTSTAVKDSQREYIGRLWKERVSSPNIDSVTPILQIDNRPR